MALKYIIRIVFLVCFLFFTYLEVMATPISYRHGNRRSPADSIMTKVLFFAPFYERIISEYNAELYVKGEVDIRKKNHLIHYVPTMFRLRKGVRKYLMEVYSDIHFTAPNVYDHKVKAQMGTSSDFWELDGRLPEYFHINIYSPSLLYDKLVSPLAPNAMKYYTYRIDSIMGEAHNLNYKISFVPKTKSFQLVSGYFVVSENVWSVREIRLSGHSEMLRINLLMRMGDVGKSDEFLPVHYDANGTFRFLGNVINCKYIAALNYKTIIQEKSFLVHPKSTKSEYDLSDSYTLSCDTSHCLLDTAYFKTIRPIPLSFDEQKLYQDFFLHLDTLARFEKHRNKIIELGGQLGDALINNYRVNLSKMGSIRFSPLINPFLLSYSGSNGFAYRQDFKYNVLFPGDRLLRVRPKLGYNFKRKEFYWSFNSDFDYWPQKHASIHISVGNGNRIYSSDVLDKLKSIPDSIFDFNQIHLDYFNDLYFKFRHSWEIVNGLSLDIGFAMHKRTEVNRSNFTPTKSSSDVPSDIIDQLRHTYNSFAPRASLSWTPGQYYYMNGKRKVNLYSKYPTLSIDWERGVSGVFNSTGKYERFEFDVQHSVPLGLMRHFYYRFGWGAFTNQKEMFFVDFANFTRSNLPIGWNDEIGGVFQLLDGRWYNSSRKYIRGHLMYEAPFFLIRHLKKYTQYVLNERFYLNALAVPHLKPYIEAGYGIGTNLFDFGAFVSFANWKYQEIGCKFTFELFNR